MGRHLPIQLIHVLGMKTKENKLWIPFRLVCLAYLLLPVKWPGQLFMSAETVLVYFLGAEAANWQLKATDQVKVCRHGRHSSNLQSRPQISCTHKKSLDHLYPNSPDRVLFSLMLCFSPKFKVFSRPCLIMNQLTIPPWDANLDCPWFCLHDQGAPHTL